MNFQLTETQEMIQNLARDFAEKELAPLASVMDKSGSIPHVIIEKLAEIGFMGINVPEEYGGSGLDMVCKALVISELAKKCASTAEVLSVHTMAIDAIIRLGTEEQKQKYLSAAAQGKIAAFALTEPGAGSDASARQDPGRSGRGRIRHQRYQMLY